MTKSSKRRSRPNFCCQYFWPSIAVTVILLHLLVYHRLHDQAFSIERIIERPPLVWSNKYDLVHVVHSRFMQHQGNLTHLGRARLELFKSFCLPTLQHQSTQEFLWILSVDPDLDADLKSELLQLVRDVPNVIVLAQNGYPEGFRNVTPFDSSPLWSGSRELLENYQRASQNHTLLETQLDADDGLHSEYLERVQQNVNQTLRGRKAWKVFCIMDQVEWQFYGLPQSDRGLLLPILGGYYCPTPGVTWAYSTKVGLKARGVDARQHQFIGEYFDDCKKEPHHKCLQRMQATDSVPFWALRARTPTSHGTNQLLIPNVTKDRRFEFRKYKRRQDKLWENVTGMFGVQAVDAEQTRRKIDKDLKNIIEDAMKGRCTQDNSCKQATKKLLESLMEHVHR